MKRAILLLLIAAATALAQEEEKEDLRFLVIEALSNNPDIAAQVFRMQVFENKIPQAGALEDPELTLKWMEIPGAKLNQAMYTNLELMQMFRFPTKLVLERDIARIQSEHAHHDHLERVLQIIAQLKSSYAMLWYSREAIALNRENQQFLRQILDAATTQYAVGKTSQQDVLKTNIELAKLKVEEVSLHQEIMSAESMLHAILNRRAGEAIGPLEPLKPGAISYDAAQLVKYAMANRPMIVHDSLSIAESNLMLKMQKQEYVPDLRLSLEYVNSPILGHKRWSIMAGISLPFAPWTLSKASARVEEASAERSMRQSMYIASRRMIEAQIIENVSKLKSADSRVQTYQTTILPQLDQSLRTSLIEYQTGRTSYLMLLDSYRMYQMSKMEAAMALMQYHQALASLERSVGVMDISIISQEN